MWIWRNYSISLKEYNKRSKYKDLEAQSEKVWHRKTMSVLVKMGVLGTIKKGTDKHINKIPGSPCLYEIPNFAFCGTAHLLKSILSMWLNNVTDKKPQKHK